MEMHVASTSTGCCLGRLSPSACGPEAASTACGPEAVQEKAAPECGNCPRACGPEAASAETSIPCTRQLAEDLVRHEVVAAEIPSVRPQR